MGYVSHVRLRAVAASIAVVGLVSTGCAQLANQLPDVVEPPDPGGEPCARLAVKSCALPYPNDEFTAADGSSPTGRRLAVPEGLLPDDLLNALGPGASIGDAFDGADGFSALSPVIFELDRAVDPASLPADGGDVFVVVDRQTGERAEIRAEVWTEAAFHGGLGTIVMAWPVTRWNYGHAYVAGVGGLEGLWGAAPARHASVVAPDEDTTELIGDLAAAGQDRSRLQSLTAFTVGSAEAATRDIRSMASTARGEDHPVRNLRSDAPVFFEHGSATITGEVRTTDFRDADGVVDPDHQPGHEWVPFVLTVPRDTAPPRGTATGRVPVAVYGHGLTINKESMFIVASTNARHGVATIAIDVPNHGARQEGQGGYLLDLTSPRSLGRLVGLPQQGIVDHVSLVRAVVDHLGEIDLAPWSMDGSHGDGIADLDTSLLLYEGTSMGGVLGLAEYALIPEFDAAFLQVPGAGILDILSHSLLWPLFSSVIPSGASAGDAAALFGAASMLLDPGDSTHLVDEIRESGRPLIAQVGIGDAVVPEFAADRLVRLAALPRIGPAHTDILAAGEISELGPDGRALQEIWPLHSSSLTFGFMGHLIFAEDAAQPLLNTWLDQRISGAGIPGERAPTG